MQINTKAIHYRVSKFFWYWSIWRGGERPKNLCSYFWLRVVLPIPAFIASGIVCVVAGIIMVGGTAILFIGPLSCAIWWYIDPVYSVYDKEGVLTYSTDTGNNVWPFFLTLQLIIWWYTIRVSWLEKTLFPDSHTLRVVKEAIKSKKEGVCPLITYKND